METLKDKEIKGCIEFPESTLKKIQEFFSQPHIFERIVESERKEMEIKEA